MKSPKRNRSRSRSREEFKYPPYKSQELESLIVYYLNSAKLSLPMDINSIIRGLRMNMKTVHGRMMMRWFPIEEIFLELARKDALKLEDFYIGSRKTYMLTSVSRETLIKLDKELTKNRPKKSHHRDFAYATPVWLRLPFIYN